MYSQCPDCQARFRVTADVLRVAHGTVRCGRCGSAFDALARLSDTLPPPAPAAVAPLLSVVEPELAAPSKSHASEFHFSADDLEKVFVDARDWQDQYGEGGAADAVVDPLPPGTEPSELLVDEAEPLEDITLEGERIQIEVPPGFLDDAIESDAPALADHELPHFKPDLEIHDDLRRELGAEIDLDATDRFRALDETAIASLAQQIEAEEPAPTPTPAPRPTPRPAPVLEDTSETVTFKVTDDLRALAARSASQVPPLPEVVTAPLGRASEPAPAAPAARRPWREPEPAPAKDDADERPPGSVTLRPWRTTANDDELLSTRLGADERGHEDDEPRGGSALWAVGCLVLVLALCAQLVHYFRQDLVRNPQLGPTLAAVYDALGLQLAPNWDPTAFEVRQWGDAAADTQAGRLNVRASIRNKAAFAQPFPLLRVELEDRFGGTVATRDFEPAEYLKSPAQAKRLLTAGASAEADLEIADPGDEAVGYRLNVCLRESQAILRCAQGPG